MYTLLFLANGKNLSDSMLVFPTPARLLVSSPSMNNNCCVEQSFQHLPQPRHPPSFPFASSSHHSPSSCNCHGLFPRGNCQGQRALAPPSEAQPAVYSLWHPWLGSVCLYPWWLAEE
ncbi:hypothetical protein SAY86_022280 [Trapa natans]|uniref:Uncharacterized protein n=1 Tax=Trapa natans TaxID=22666 RepID=A0AAN7M3C1_TRANT|nr:hypothetical protein SAY86_022280 [Trapa natans]